MRYLLTFGLVVFIFLTSSFSSDPVEESEIENPLNRSTTVMSYNIDSENTENVPAWDERKNIIAQIIRTKRPEVLGIQESTASQTTWLSNNVIGYEWYSLQKDNGFYWQETCPIFYSTRAYERLDQGSFWLAGSSMNNEDEAKAVNWLHLKHKVTGKKVHVFNTQFNNVDKARRVESARLLKERIESIVNGNTYVILGDLSCEPHEEPLSWMTSWVKDSYESSLVNTTSDDNTFYGYDNSVDVAKRVDYVLLSMDIPANSHEVIDVPFRDSYPSDHLPVFCRFRLQ